MPKPKPLVPRNIKFTEEQTRFIKRRAAADGHYNFSAVVKRLIDKEIHSSAAN